MYFNAGNAHPAWVNLRKIDFQMAKQQVVSTVYGPILSIREIKQTFYLQIFPYVNLWNFSCMLCQAALFL